MSADETVDEQDQAGSQPQESAFWHLARRMKHVYKTRVRTTTVILVVAFISLSVFYAFSSQHYSVEPIKQQVRQVQQTEEPTKQEPIPSSTMSTPPSTSAETEPSTSTEIEPRTSPGTTETDRPLFPNPFRPKTPTTETTVAPTTTPPGSDGP